MGGCVPAGMGTRMAAGCGENECRMQTGERAWGKEEQNRSTVSDNDVVISGKSPPQELSKAIISTLQARKLRHGESDLFTVTQEGQVPWCGGICSHHQSSWCKPIAINPVSSLHSPFSVPHLLPWRGIWSWAGPLPCKTCVPSHACFAIQPTKSHILLRTQSHLGSCMGCVGNGICFAVLFCFIFLLADAAPPLFRSKWMPSG